jgi:C1A family cysteine protease
MRLLIFLALCVAMAPSAFSQALKFKTGLVFPKGNQWKLEATWDGALNSKRDALPAKFDWREKVKLPPVKNQGSCGSCWAFATTGVLESAYIIFKEAKDIDLAEQELVSCDTSSYGCGGGFFSAHSYQVDPGQSAEKEFPYVARNVRCKKDLSHDYDAASWAYVGEPNRAPTVDEIRAAIVEHGPVAVDVYADGRMSNYSGGIFSGNAGWSTNHMVVLVGYNQKEKYWIMRNSWGSSWGEKGYMRIKYGSNRIGSIASYVVLD